MAEAPQACAAFRASLHEYVAGRLEGASGAEASSHARRCAPCRREAAALSRALALVRAEAPAPPAWLASRTYARLSAQARHDAARAAVPLLRRLFPQIVATGALTAAALFVAVLLRPAFSEATRWAAVRGAKTVASGAPPVAKAARHSARIGNQFVLAVGKALEVTLGF